MVQRMITWLLALFLCLAATSAWGAGFAIYDNSSRGTALCGAMVAQGKDPAAAFFNPAAVTNLQGTQIMAGVGTYTPSYTVVFSNGENEKLDSQTWFIPHFYASHQVNDNVWFSLATFTPFGLGTKYRENWAGRYNSYESVIQSMEVNPSIVVKASDKLSFAIGCSVERFEIPTLKRKVKPKTLIVSGLMKEGYDRVSAEGIYEYQFANDYDSLPDIDQDAQVDDNGFRFNVGFLYKLYDNLTLGINYRSWVNHRLRGDVSYENVQDPEGSSLLADKIFDTYVVAQMKLPDTAVIGASWQATEKLMLEFDIQHMRWSRYENLTYTFGNEIGTVTSTRDWHDASCYRFGAEYNVTDAVDVRCGYLFDESPIPAEHIDFTLPTNSRHMVTMGLGYHTAKFSVNCHYGLIIMVQRDIEANDEEYIPMDWTMEDAYTHLIGMEVAYRF